MWFGIVTFKKIWSQKKEIIEVQESGQKLSVMEK